MVKRAQAKNGTNYKTYHELNPFLSFYYIQTVDPMLKIMNRIYKVPPVNRGYALN